MKVWIRRRGPAILIMLLIYIASAIPSSQLPDYGKWDVVVKKGGHIFGYALLSVALLHALSKGRRISRFHLIAAALLTLLYSLTDEWHQSFTPGRNASVWDVGIDTAGGIIGLVLYYFVKMPF
jgi:VanZ family protein